MSNTEALGRMLYTDYVYLFQAAGLVLLTAMIGAIVLTCITVPTSSVRTWPSRPPARRKRRWKSARCLRGRGV
jgi:hypothetical protein